MAVTRLKRKAKRNKQTASIRRTTIKQLTAKPVIKNIDIEEIKASFVAASKKATKAKEQTPKAENTSVKEEKTENTPVKKVKAEKKPSTKKPPKKENK